MQTATAASTPAEMSHFLCIRIREPGSRLDLFSIWIFSCFWYFCTLEFIGVLSGRELLLGFPLAAFCRIHAVGCSTDQFDQPAGDFVAACGIGMHLILQIFSLIVMGDPQIMVIVQEGGVQLLS